MRDTKLINAYVVKQARDKKQLELFRNLKKEVETGANGTQNYMIKKGINKNTIAKK
jgi:hypothetical protein|tara:strand:+ start:123 stop:290 length:168 start_codon:yes stop_codon:yes gene_type:complete